jgi:predicted dehydrogenase
MIHGTKGSFIKNGEDPQEELLKAGHLPVGPDWGKEDEQQYGLLHTEINGEIIKKIYPSLQGSFGNYYQNLYATIRKGAPLQETAEHGLQVIQLIEKAFESSRLRRTIDIG